MQQRIDEGVVARAHVLQVEDEGVQPVEHLRRRHASLAIEAVDREPAGGVPGRLHLHEVLGVAVEAVLRAEQRRQAHRAGRAEQRRGVGELRRDRGAVRDESDACTAQITRTGEDLLETGPDAPHSAIVSVKRPTAPEAPGRVMLPVTFSPSTRPSNCCRAPRTMTAKRSTPLSKEASCTGRSPETPPDVAVRLPVSREPAAWSRTTIVFS